MYVSIIYLNYQFCWKNCVSMSLYYYVIFMYITKKCVNKKEGKKKKPNIFFIDLTQESTSLKVSLITTNKTRCDNAPHTEQHVSDMFNKWWRLKDWSFYNFPKINIMGHNYIRCSLFKSLSIFYVFAGINNGKRDFVASSTLHQKNIIPFSQWSQYTRWTISSWS